MLGQLIAFEMPGELKRDLGDELGGQMTKLVHSIYANAKGQAEGQRFHLTVQVPETVTDVIPAYAKRQRELARMIERTNRAKNIGIAIHNYHSTFNEFPFPNGRSGAPKAEQGKLSWRVHLLPYLDQYPLYEEFKLDEAWDSDHNKKLLEKMPDVFKLSDQTKPGHTQFVLPGGEGFMGSKKGSVRFRDITDGSSNTIMVLSVVPDKAVPWTKPGAFELDVDKASEILGGGLRGFLAIFGDARVSTLDGNIDANSLKALLTISGNEVVYPEQFRLR